MKEYRMLVWITQLGLSVAAPLAGFILLAVWLRSRFGLGGWVIAVGCVLGLVSAASGLYNTLKVMSDMDSRGEDRKGEPPASFNEHE